ncbi:MAG: FAD-binding oxidoreductase [Rhodobacteraceae bacterium]|nr:FAD-binding oxidoreductase [Paracoccaceae bacterium]
MAEEAGIAVVGAGIIGLASALRLAAEGHDVTLIDPAPPGSGASSGNAGTIAGHAVQPVGTPAVLRSLPALLFDRDSPLAIRRAALPALAPWLLRFLRQSLPGAARRNARAIAALLADAGPLWRELAAAAGASDLLRDRGCLYLYDTAEALSAAGADLALRRALGVRVEMLGPAEAAAFEPALPPVAGAAFFPDALFLTDPGAMMARLADAARTAGVRLRAARVERLARRAGGVALSGPGLELRARRAVIAAGAHSRRLAAQAGDRVPLDTERGYHAEWDMAAPPLSRPVCPVARGFYLCPMAGRLRAAGTVELGGLSAPPSPHRIARLVAGARTLFPGLGPPDRTWMGFRPSMPDSLPVIGASRGGAEVILAFGHGHIGLTLAPATARIVADLVAGRAPPAAAGPCTPSRFG